MKLSLELQQQTPTEPSPLEAATIVSKALTALLHGKKLENTTEVMDALHVVHKVCREKELAAL